MNSTTGHNATMLPSGAPTSAPLRMSNLVTHLNYFLASLYIVIMLVSLYLLYVKLRRERKIKVGLLYVFYIFSMCVIRFSYLLTPTKSWVKLLKREHSASYMNFIDLLPELLFVSIFLLTTVMWGIAWSRTRKIRVFNEKLIIYIHSGIMIGLLLIAAFLSAAIREEKIKYARVVFWEAYYVIAVSAVAIAASAILGGLLFHAFRHVKFQSSQITQRHLNHLLALLFLTTISFVLKGVWNLVIGSIARKQWKQYEMSTPQFATLWFFYYFLTEHLPLGLALVQQWTSEADKDRDSNRSSSNDKSSNDLKDSKNNKNANQSSFNQKSSQVSYDYQPRANSQAVVDEEAQPLERGTSTIPMVSIGVGEAFSSDMTDGVSSV